MARIYENQGSLFPTDDSRDRSFEYKRAKKYVRKLQTKGHVDLIVKIPYVYTNTQFIVSRTTGGVYHCQACVKNPACKHIRAIKKLLQLRKEAGYTGISEKQFLQQVLPSGEVR